MSTAADVHLRAQYRRAVKQGWVPHVYAAAAEFDVRPDVLLAIASRETSMGGRELQSGRFEWLEKPGDGGHGFGLMQIDKGSFPEWVKTGEWKQAGPGILKGAQVLAGKRDGLLQRAGQIVRVRARKSGEVYKFTMPVFTLDGLERTAIAAYNSGDWAAYHVSKGRDPDYGTTGKDYQKDVLARAELFRVWLAADSPQQETNMAGNPSAYQPGVAASFRDRVVTIGATVQQQFSQAWTKAQHDGDDGEFIRRLAWACRQAGIPCWLNGKRGNPNDMSKDILVFENATGARDTTGRLAGIEIIDCIINHELPSARVDMLDVTVHPGPTGQLVMPDGAAVEPTDLGGGGTATPGPTPGGPIAGWEVKHSDLLARFAPAPTAGNRAYIQRVAEQFAFSFPGEGWGVKSVDANRPVSDNVIARQTAAGLVGYRLIPLGRAETPTSISLAGQRFSTVTPQNHLGVSGPGPTPTPTPGPTPPPTSGKVYPGDRYFDPASEAVFKNYEGRGEAVNRGVVAWIARIIWRVTNQGQTIDQAVDTVIAEMPPVPR